ncbi:biotin/lipoyl-binding protein [Desulfovibrio sp.]|uniref:biotin/lipoyl-binding protein n=1 Tax=Desulfovibrio sp. TaxID=885 RepID=UPI0030781992
MRQKILAAVLLVGVAVALGWYFLWDRTQGSLVLYGNVEIRQVDVSFRVDGRIAQVLVDEGDSVRAGQELARLDDDLLRQSGTRRRPGWTTTCCASSGTRRRPSWPGRRPSCFAWSAVTVRKKWNRPAPPWPVPVPWPTMRPSI